MFTHEKQSLSLATGIDTLQDAAEKAFHQVRWAERNTLRQIRLHPRAATALALFTGLTSGVVVGAIVRDRLQAR